MVETHSNESVSQRVKQLVDELQQIDNVEKIDGLVTGGYLDSFNVLLLVDSLEKSFDVKLNVRTGLLTRLDSIQKISELIQEKKQATHVS